MHEFNHNKTDDVIYEPQLEMVSLPKSNSSISRRREIKERIDHITEQRELRRLIENPY